MINQSFDHLNPLLPCILNKPIYVQIWEKRGNFKLKDHTLKGLGSGRPQYFLTVHITKVHKEKLDFVDH